ncbi:MAG: thioredoxin family protein [Atribacterota bacterium]
MLQITNKTEFNDFTSSEDIVLIDFYTDYCMPCKMLAPVLEELSEEGHSIAKVNAMDAIEIAQEQGVSAVPTLIFYKNEKEIKKLVGIQPKNTIKEIFDEEKR